MMEALETPRKRIRKSRGKGLRTTTGWYVDSSLLTLRSPRRDGPRTGSLASSRDYGKQVLQSFLL